MENKKDFIPFGSIEKFKNIYEKIERRYGANKINEEGKLTNQMPLITFEGTVKVHGTNGGVVVWSDGEVTYQSRSRIVSLYQDNAGFYMWASSLGTDHWQGLTANLLESCDAVAIFGEWAGDNIQAGVAVSGMSKRFIIFSVQKITKNPDFGKATEDGKVDEQQYFREFVPLDLETQATLKLSHDCHLSHEFGTFKLPVDFSDPAEAMETLNKITLEIEQNCPVGAILNPKSENTIGEGLVWQGTDEAGNFYQFKDKGKLHERGKGDKKPKLPKTLTPEQKQAVDGFMQSALTMDRLLQGLEVMQEMQHEIIRKNTNVYLKWVMSDIHKEHGSELRELADGFQITWKQIGGSVTRTVREFYLENAKT